MAWVHQKNTKPKRKDPAEAIESTRSLLLFLSGRPPPKSITQTLHKPPLPIPNDYVEPKPSRTHHEHDYDEERSSRHYHEVPENHHQELDADAHAFSFSRDRLVPIAPKHPPAPRVDRERVNHQKRITPRTMTQYSRDPSPPPPPRPRAKPKSVANSGPKLPRHYVAPDTSSRIVSPMWASATTPLQM